MPIALVEDRPSLVIVGVFAPALFHPQWFRAQGLLGESEAKHASVKFVTPEMSEWSTEWLTVQAMQNRLQFQGKLTSNAEPLRDLALGTLQVLDQTDCSALGLNRAMHFDVGGEEAYDRVGDTLAPKALWESPLRGSGRLGLKVLQIERPGRSDGLSGKAIVTIAPSVKHTHHVFIDVNNEIRPEGPKGTIWALEVIRDRWTHTFAAARETGEQLLEGILA
jgi:hypothetical protein